MFRLTREVRLAVNALPDEQLDGKPANSYGGFPSLTGVGQYLTLAVTLRGDLRPESSYLRNIKEIDDVVRGRAIPLLARHTRAAFRGELQDVPALLGSAHELLADAWPGCAVERLMLALSPFLSLAAHAEELPMVRLSHKFEFSASHRLFNRALSADENRRLFGKCSNPHGHGHNYELQVTLTGEPHRINGVLVDLPAFERIVGSAVIDRFDHKNLNVEVPEFADLIPSVENIARVIYKLLQPRFGEAGVRLAAVTVWETPKTWCEYSE